ncbi:MAG: tetratricopeptide repeat protein [Phocaeicola sp.]|nr:tetratricopeptide repeat protein [Phocaeicola sp.]
MKNMALIYLLAGCVCLLSCTSEREYPSAMRQAVSCMDDRPDSALVLLETLSDSIAHAPQEIQMYYRLLTIKAKDKLYIPHTTDSVILSIVGYYREKGDKERLFESYYYLGGTYRDLNDISRALKAYHQAVEVGEGTEQTLLRGMTYGQMGILFAYQELYDESRQMMRKALQCYGELGDSVKYANTLATLARTYNGKNENDSALYYYKESYRIARKYRKDKLAAGIAGELGCFYYNEGQVELAKQVLLDVLPARRKSGNVLLCLGCIYKDEGQVDSARYYWGDVLKYGNLHKRCYANYYLAELEKAQGNEDLSLAYDDQHRLLQDSINTITQTDVVEKLHLLYNFQHEEQKNYRLALENERYLARIYLLVFIFIVSVTLVVIVIQHIHVKNQRVIEQEKRLRLIQEEQYKKSLAYIHDNELKLQEVEKQLLEAGKQSDTLRQELLLSQRKVLEASKHQSVTLLSNSELLEDAFRQSDIYAFFHQAEHGDLKVEDENWDALCAAINVAYPRFTDRLYELCPKLSQRELHICYLIKLSLSCMSMTRILICTPSAITQTRKRLYKKMTGKDGTGDDLDKLILDL